MLRGFTNNERAGIEDANVTWQIEYLKLDAVCIAYSCSAIFAYVATRSLPRLLVKYLVAKNEKAMVCSYSTIPDAAWTPYSSEESFNRIYWRVTKYRKRSGSMKALLAAMIQFLKRQKGSMLVIKWWRTLLGYGRRLYCAAASYQLISWEPKVPDGKTRARWKCVSAPTFQPQ
jgi:hypothetical protein